MTKPNRETLNDNICILCFSTVFSPVLMSQHTVMILRSDGQFSPIYKTAVCE